MARGRGKSKKFVVMYCKLYLQEVTKNDDELNKLRHNLLQGKTCGKDYALSHHLEPEEFADVLYEILIQGNKKEYELTQEELECLMKMN